MGKRDLPMRSFPKETARLQRDVREALGAMRADLSEQTAFTPARAADWAGTAPATLADAVNRLAYHIASGGGAAPILELP